MMRSFKLRNAVATILASLVTAAALSQAGCLQTQPSNADEAARGGASGADRTAARERSAEGESGQSGELQQPLLRAFGDALDDASDLKDSERDEAWKILKEADPVLTQIKEENRKAIEAANRPATLDLDRAKKPKLAEDASDGKKETADSKEETADSKKDAAEPEPKQQEPASKEPAKGGS